MKDEDSEDLLELALGGDNLDGLRRSTLEQGLAAMQRRRRQRRLGQAGAIVCLLILVDIVIQWRPVLPIRIADTVTRAELRPNLPGMDPKSEIRMITDEQLFALFPNRPLALVGKPGHQQLVFLDGSN